MHQKIGQDVTPNLVGLNSVDATSLLEKAGMTADFNPQVFQDTIAASDNFKQTGLNWFVCEQVDSPGSKANFLGSEILYVAKDCNGFGVLPRVTGSKAGVAWQILIDHGFNPSYNGSNELNAANASLLVCKQDHPEGSTKIDEDIVLSLSPNCAGYGILPNVVGLKASVAWTSLKNQGFNPTYDAGTDLDATSAAMFVCSQDHPVGSTTTSEDINLVLAENCATSPDNPNSHDGTKKFVNEAKANLSDLGGDLESIGNDVQGDHRFLILAADLSLSLSLNSLSTMIAPSKYATNWTRVTSNMKSSIDRFDKALSQWESQIINSDELLQYVYAMAKPASAIKSLVDSIPYPN